MLVKQGRPVPVAGASHAHACSTLHHVTVSADFRYCSTWDLSTDGVASGDRRREEMEIGELWRGGAEGEMGISRRRGVA